jgi:hypothetical protein
VLSAGAITVQPLNVGLLRITEANDAATSMDHPP